MSLEGSRTRGDLEIESDNLLSESDEEYGEFSEASSSENDGEKREESVTVIPPTPPRPENRGVQRCLFGREKSSLIERCYTNAPNSSLHTPTIHPLPRAPKKVQSEPPKSLSSSNSAVQSQLGELLTEVRHTFKKLDDVTNRLDTVEKRLKSLEEHPTPSSSEMSDVKKQKVPPQVRYLVRDIYKTKMDMEEDFSGFNIKKRYTDQENQSVVSQLITEARSQDGAIPLTQIKDAVRRFFQTKLEEATLKAKGTYGLKVQKQRRRNRITKKLELRKAALDKTNAITTERKAKWKEVLNVSFISSEESGEEVVDSESRPILYVKSIPWRASKVTKFMKQLDEKVKKHQTKRAKLQTMTRKPGAISSRQKPSHEFGENFWGFA